MTGCVVNCRGLTSESGQNNCFLNVIVQSLWHLGCFRTALLAPGRPAPRGPPADRRVVDALVSIFHAFAAVRTSADCCYRALWPGTLASDHLRVHCNVMLACRDTLLADGCKLLRYDTPGTCFFHMSLVIGSDGLQPEACQRGRHFALDCWLPVQLPQVQDVTVY